MTHPDPADEKWWSALAYSSERCTQLNADLSVCKRMSRIEIASLGPVCAGHRKRIKAEAAPQT